jgi:hypothetical protein
MDRCDNPRLAGIPEALIRATVRQAEDDADRVGQFLEDFGFRSPEARTTPLALPPALLMGLAAVLRLHAWEQDGVRRHLPVDLPTARDAVRDLFCAMVDRSAPGRLEAFANGLTLRVYAVWMVHFAWDGLEVLGADLVLGDAEEDALADALARFLWNTRHTLDVRQGGDA